MTMGSEAEALAIATLPGLPRDDDGPVFAEPWQARAFALALALHGRGVFTWSEWAEVLGAEISRAQNGGDPDSGDSYYHHWLAALERLVTQKQVTTADTLERTRLAWDRATDRTPHGAPIDLQPQDFA